MAETEFRKWKGLFRTAQPKPNVDRNTGAGSLNPLRSMNPSRLMIKMLLSSAGPEHKDKPSCVTRGNCSPKAPAHLKEGFLAVIPTVLHLEGGLRHLHRASLILQVWFICLMKNYQGTNKKSSSFFFFYHINVRENNFSSL